MSTINKPERVTQNRVVKLFLEQLDYTYLGNLEDKPNNSNIEIPQLIRYLAANGYDQGQINKALDKLQSAANNHGQNLYHNNKDVYQLLRYGVFNEIWANTQDFIKYGACDCPETMPAHFIFIDADPPHCSKNGIVTHWTGKTACAWENEPAISGERLQFTQYFYGLTGKRNDMRRIGFCNKVTPFGCFKVNIRPLCVA